MKTISPFLQVFLNRKMAALSLLGFASGLPYLLSRETLQTWMAVEKIDLATIGLFGLAASPYSFKFLWSPLLDRFVPPFLGRRRGWLVLSQIALTLAIAAVSFQQPKQSVQLLAVNAVMIAFFSATQDIACDAYRTDILEKREMGAGAAVFVMGYRIALLIAGALALILADLISWQWVYLCLAGLMGINIIFSIWAPEPTLHEVPPKDLFEAIWHPFREFFQRSGILRAVLILVFIVLYKLGDSLLSNMVNPFLIEIGFTQTDIGAVKGGMGLLATIVGVLAGGSFLSRLGINRSLWIFGILQAVSNLAYLVLARLGYNYQFMVLAINIENFCAGLGTAAFVAFLMSLCNRRFSATQYALLSSLPAVSRDLIAASGGAIAKATGWPQFFLITLIAAIPGLVLLPFFAPWNSPSEMTMSASKLDE